MSDSETRACEYMRKTDAARFLACTPRALDNLIKAKGIPTYRLGSHHILLRRSDLEALVELSREDGTPAPDDPRSTAGGREKGGQQ